MEAKNRPIPELVAERKALAGRLTEINRQLEKVDAELFSRLETALDAFGMWSNPPRPAFSTSTPPPAPARNMLTASVNKRLEDPHQTVVWFNDQTSERPAPIGAKIVSHVREYLTEYRRPLKTGEIFELLKKEGVEVPGKDPRNNLSAHLSRSRDLVRTRAGWWIASEKEEPPEGGS